MNTQMPRNRSVAPIDPTHDRIDPVGQDGAERERDEAERQHDGRMPERVERAE
jgi:hypothetical protein